MTLFSIIIPCYNQAHFLEECLLSLFVQRYENWEAIIINDGSTDSTSKTANKYVTQDSRIKLIEKENGGLSSARNKGIENATGSHFIFLDADDLLLNDCLQYYSEILKDNIDFIQSGYLSFKKNLNTILYKRKNIAPYKDFYKTIHQANIGPVNGFVVSKSLVSKIGFFNEDLTSCEDWDYWIRCSKADFVPLTISEIFAAYRFVPGSMGKNAIRMLQQGLRVININHINQDNTNISNQEFINNEIYKNACLGHLIFTTSIALFNSQNEDLEKIKKEYFNEIYSKIDYTYFQKIANYQTYRDFGIIEYFFFYNNNKSTYKGFFDYLKNINCIDNKNYSIIFKEIFPTPFRLAYKKVVKKLKK